MVQNPVKDFGLGVDTSRYLCVQTPAPVSSCPSQLCWVHGMQGNPCLPPQEVYQLANGNLPAPSCMRAKPAAQAALKTVWTSSVPCFLFPQAKGESVQ